MTLDFLWHSAWFFASSKSPCPNWSGFMMHATSQSITAYDVASVDFLPIIDLNSSNESCIYSTLLFVIEEAKKSKIPVPVITFDQPLWQKALGIIKLKKLRIVCRLGGFHTLMSFLGSIGNIMKGSGLDELFEEVYAEDTVKHINSGHAVARAIRAHLLVQSALINHITCTLVDQNKLVIEDIESSYKKAMDEGFTNDNLVTLSESKAIRDMEESIATFSNTMSEKSRTTKLWLSYINYIKVVKEFIVAERSCNWHLHIQSITKMQNLFAATGHRNYAKCSRICVQEMESWTSSNGWLQEQFEAGRHAVRRSNRFWAGIWSDLVTEQTLMRSLKCAGGLTRGRGFGENARNLWTMSVGFTATVHESMIQLSGVQGGPSDQNVEMGKNRRIKDTEDCQKFFDWIEVRNSFNTVDNNLHSLSTGCISVIGKDKVNCDDAESVGAKIQGQLNDVIFTEAKILKKYLIVSLEALTNESLDIGCKDPVIVNPTLLFTRLAAIAEREENVEQYFDYELNHQALSLFKNGLMRKPDKAALKRSLLQDKDSTSTNITQMQHVLDGGALLHRVPWSKGMKFNEIAAAYVGFV
ncbi:uncharacterized protein [Clytia hemisphaerica]|uniref:uncharacterized protein n=1 Tax=Clytia hemisphaerica TaxID=252671 RepID=UPI0034D678F2